MMRALNQSRFFKVFVFCFSTLIILAIFIFESLKHPTKKCEKISIPSQISEQPKQIETEKLRQPITEVYGYDYLGDKQVIEKLSYFFHDNKIFWTLESFYSPCYLMPASDLLEMQKGLQKIPEYMQMAKKHDFKITGKDLIRSENRESFLSGSFVMSFFTEENGKNPRILISITDSNNQFKEGKIFLDKDGIISLIKLIGDIPSEFQKWKENDKKQCFLN